MTNTYNTGNALGSTSPKDLYDNASNMDEAMNSTSPAWTDRFGKRRETFAGFEAAFQQFLINSGYETPVPYAAGEVVTRPTQTFIFGGEVYRPIPGMLPFTTTNWATDSSKFLFVGDSSLRSDLSSADVDKGIALVKGGMRTVANVTELKALPKTGAQVAYLLSHSGLGTGGAGMVYLDVADVTTLVGDDGLVFVATDGGVWKRPYTQTLNILDFGGKGDNVFDNGPIILKMNASMATMQQGTMYFPAGFWKTSETIKPPGSNKRVKGDGEDVTLIRSIAAAKPVIEYVTGFGGGIVQDLTVSHSVTPTAGGDGILWAVGGVTDEGKIRNVKAVGNWNGLFLGGTGYGEINNIFASGNLQNGISILNSDVFTICQWYLKGMLLQANGGSGLRVQSVATVAGALSIGEVSGLRTFANTGYGIIAAGTPTCGVYSMRMKDCFLGADGQAEIYLDTIGNLHTLTDTFIELAGNSTTGPTLSTPATQNAHGIVLTASTPDLSITGGIINGCSNSGIYSEQTAAGALRLNGVTLANNGNVSNPGIPNRCGVFTANTGTLQAVAVRAYGQSYGSYNNGTGNNTFVGCDFRGNIADDYAGGVAGDVNAGNR